MVLELSVRSWQDGGFRREVSPVVLFGHILKFWALLHVLQRGLIGRHQSRLNRSGLREPSDQTAAASCVFSVE